MESSSSGAPEATQESPQPPIRSPTQQSLFWTQPNKSLESFAIATTPFHEPDNDGEYYMDEAGNWLHRWVTSTRVKSARPVTSRPDSGYEEEVTLESSESSEEERRLRHEVSEQGRGPPKMQRHSRSSVIPSDKANHRSPAPSGSSPRTKNQEFAPQTFDGHQSSADSESGPKKALSAPSSPRQEAQPLSATPSPAKSRRSSQPHLVRPPLRARHTTKSNATSRRPSTAASNVNLPISTSSSYARLRNSRTGSTEDPYVVHRQAVAIFAPKPASTASDDDSRRPRRVVQAADFLAQRPDEVPLPSRSASKDSVGSTLRSFGQTQPAVADEEECNKEAEIVFLKDHDVTIDWTHPETRKKQREKELKKRTGLRGSIRRLARHLGGKQGDADDGNDGGSVRRMKMH